MVTHLVNYLVNCSPTALYPKNLYLSFISCKSPKLLALEGLDKPNVGINQKPLYSTCLTLLYLPHYLLLEWGRGGVGSELVGINLCDLLPSLSRDKLEKWDKLG